MEIHQIERKILNLRTVGGMEMRCSHFEGDDNDRPIGQKDRIDTPTQPQQGIFQQDAPRRISRQRAEQGNLLLPRTHLRSTVQASVFRETIRQLCDDALLA
jgi:hypothetical protein